MSVTAPVFQLERSWLKLWAPKNTGEEGGERRNSFQTYHYNLLWRMLVTAPVFQLEMSWLKALAPRNTVEKGGERRNSFQTYATTTYFGTCPSLGRYPSWRGLGWSFGHRWWHRTLMKKRCEKGRCERRNSFQTYHYNLLWVMLITWEVFQLEMAPYGEPVASGEAAKIGQNPV